MKNLLRILFVAFAFITPVKAKAGTIGLTPCTPTAQPADLSFSGVSANVHLSTCGGTLIAFNNSASDARFRIGSGSGTTALLTDMLLPTKTFITLNVGFSGLWFAAISSGSGTISFVQGNAQ